MIKFLICSLLALSFISCNTDGDNPNPDEDEENPGEITGPGSFDPTKQYKLFNKTADDEAVVVTLFSSQEKLEKNDSSDCAPFILKTRECLTIKGSQFRLVQITGDDELLCGDIARSCNPGDYEVTKTGNWFWSDFKLSSLKEDKTPSSSQNQKADEEEEEESKTCVPLECKKPEADTAQEEEETKEEAEEENS